MSCCMFRSKRTSLAKNLWKLRAKDDHESKCSAEGSDSDSGAYVTTDKTSLCELCRQNGHLKTVTYSVLRRLREHQLESLLQVIETRGGEMWDCFLLPKDVIRLGRRMVPPQILCCQIWRWPDLQYWSEESGWPKMKQVAYCASAKCNSDNILLCCNPYHWSRVVSCLSDDMDASTTSHLLANGKADDEPLEESTETCEPYRSFTNHSLDSADSHSHTSHWCSLAYWEHRRRVGRLFPVYSQSVHVFENLPRGDGLCLGTLYANEAGDGEHVRRTREKVGRGLTLCQEGSGVWVYNRSEHALFVNSPTLENPKSKSLTVVKVPAGHCLQVFHYGRSALLKTRRETVAADGPYDHNAIRISFAKGWGPFYARQFITSCPCWLEVLLAVPR